MIHKWLSYSLSATFLLCSHAPLFAEWQQHIVEPIAEPLAASAMNLKADSNQITISYLSYETELGHNPLKSAIRNGEGWNITSENFPLTDGVLKKLEVDNQGYTHALYIAKETEDLMYAHNRSGTLVSELVAASGDYPYLIINDAAFVIDQQGYAHFVTALGSDGLAIYATNQSGQWQQKTIYSKKGIAYGTIISGHSIESPSLVIDQQGYAHVALWDFKHKRREGAPVSCSLVYLTNRSNSWHATPVKLEIANDSYGMIPPYISIDKQGHSAILYSTVKERETKLNYAHNSAGFWITSTLEQSSSQGDELVALGMARDGEGRQHILYAHNNTLMYAIKENREWRKEIIYNWSTNAPIKASFSGGNGSSLHDLVFMVDTQAKPHLALVSMDDTLLYLTP